jgi:hypothetical protein
MITLEEYIARRKKEDKLIEFNMDERAENTRICVNYVFEYFNNYLTSSEAEHLTILHNENLEKFMKPFIGYDLDVQKWLSRTYTEHGNHINRHICNVIKKYPFFYLYNLDSEFRSMSYECYSQCAKRFPYLKEQTEMIFLFIKEYHRVRSGLPYNSPEDLVRDVFICDSIDRWLIETQLKHHVNIMRFVCEYGLYFSNNSEMWPTTHRIKSKHFPYIKWDYDYKQKSNLFNLMSLYRKMPKKEFTVGKKQEFEVLFMYFWTHNILLDEEYWEEYSSKVIPTLLE